MIPTITDDKSLPPTIRYSPAARKVWRRLEFMSRGTLLVHGSEALKVSTARWVDPKLVIQAMVKCGTLIPCKVDVAGACLESKVEAGLTYGKRGGDHVRKCEWCTAFALLWTYEPGNRAPMNWDEREGD